MVWCSCRRIKKKKRTNKNKTNEQTNKKRKKQQIGKAINTGSEGVEKDENERKR